MGPPSQKTKFLPETSVCQIFRHSFEGVICCAAVLCSVTFWGVLWVRAKIQSSEPSTRTTCQICINFICYIIIYKCTLVKRCFINKVREEHVKIINRINTRGAQSVTKPVNKITGVYIYTADLPLCSLTASLRHPLSALTTIPVLTCKRPGGGGGGGVGGTLGSGQNSEPRDTLPF